MPSVNDYMNAVTRLDARVRNLLREVEAVWGEVVSLAGVAAEVTRTAPESFVDHAWVERDELRGQTDTWPARGGGKEVTSFRRFRVFERSGGLRIGLGEVRAGDGTLEAIGVFLIGPADRKRLVVYFQRTDDFASTHRLWAPIRGKGGGRSYFRGAETLPPQYAGMEIVRLGTVVSNHRLREIDALLAHEDDWKTMVEHGAAQVQLRRLT